MPNHVHLVFHFAEQRDDVAKVLQVIKAPVSRKALAFLRQQAPEWLPRLTQRRGNRTEYHFWQRGGGFDRNVIEPATLGKMMDYIHLNPVRKGLVDHAMDWKWSSAGWYAGRQLNNLRVDQIPLEWGVRIGCE